MMMRCFKDMIERAIKKNQLYHRNHEENEFISWARIPFFSPVGKKIGQNLGKHRVGIIFLPSIEGLSDAVVREG